jgi:HD-like signal output (HDOD) protein
MTTTAPVENELKISETLKDNPFVERLRQHFIYGELETPSFPDIALKMRRAIQQDCEMADLVKIINMDPVISAKLIQVVNSPFYMPMQPITNCFSAINRLGRKTTRDLVITFSMKNLIKSEKPLIKKLIQQTWFQSIKVSSISYTLAKLTKKVDSDDALLSGLLHNIGALPILTFADSLPEGSYTISDIELCINDVQGQIGSIILDQWEFPENLKQVPLQSSDWFANPGEKLGLSDIVLLAKYHYFLSTPGGAELPLIDTLPAYKKLGDQPLTPEMSLQILHDAKQQIADIMGFFSG